MIYILHPRRSVVDNVDRMLKCGDPSYGGTMYGCTNCDTLKFVPFRCHSRFCPTCGNMYSIHRTTSMSAKLIQCTHRHCVFTIPEELRHFFFEDRSLLNCLFNAVRSVILRLFYKINNSEKFTPGFICVLHTFGRSINWNPHVHCLVSEGGSGNNIPWRKVFHFNFNFLRIAFRTALLNELLKHLGPSFKKTISFMYKQCKDGFYVYANPDKCEPNTIAAYVGRYLGRPVIASSRIDDYDGDSVTFHYNRHQDDVLVTEKIPVLNFIQRLIQHIPEKHFKMIRYYGIYARHRKSDERLFRAISKQKHFFLRSLNRWQISILRSFGYDPLQCPHCHSKMTFVSIFFKNQPVSLDELYKKVMNDYKCHT
ncbi:MAG: transposase [Vallitaleaceae bacterium]|nr:transposase [Vallitaleaceae bacterium]